MRLTRIALGVVSLGIVVGLGAGCNAGNGDSSGPVTLAVNNESSGIGTVTISTCNYDPRNGDVFASGSFTSSQIGMGVQMTTVNVQWVDKDGNTVTSIDSDPVTLLNSSSSTWHVSGSTSTAAPHPTSCTGSSRSI